MAFVAPLPPQQMLQWPNGTYGIAYDIRIRATQDDLPNGWNSPRSSTYRQLILKLNGAGFHRSQYSIYIQEATTAAYTWATMIDLFTIQPPGKLESTLGRLQMFYMQHLGLMDISDAAQLGGNFFGSLRAAIPVALVAPVAHMLNPPPAIPQPAGFQLPSGTRPSQAALNVGNWRA